MITISDASLGSQCRASAQPDWRKPAKCETDRNPPVNSHVQQPEGVAIVEWQNKVTKQAGRCNSIEKLKRMSIQA